MGTPLLQVNDLRAGYGKHDVLRGIDLQVEEGSLSVILGPNGAGKSTTLRSLMGLIPRVRGTIALDGEAIEGTRPEARVKRGLALAPEGRQLFPSLSVVENLMTGAVAAGRHRDAQASLEEVYGYFPRLSERRDQRAGSLSGGEQQMVTIGRALMSRPRLLLIDEASLGLAPIIVEQLFELIATINRDGTSVLVVEQNLGLVEYADTVFVMEQGELRFGGDVEAVRADLDRQVASAYMGIEERP